jgi:hypothetical protein
MATAASLYSTPACLRKRSGVSDVIFQRPDKNAIGCTGLSKRGHNLGAAAQGTAFKEQTKPLQVPHEGSYAAGMDHHYYISLNLCKKRLFCAFFALIVISMGLGGTSNVSSMSACFRIDRLCGSLMGKVLI